MSTSLRLEPADEYMHENTGEPNYNESMYFNFFDRGERLGGFLRIGNRPNERMAETTVCLYRPDGSVLFNFKRSEIAGNDRLEAGGARFEVERPFERLRIAYTGKACCLKDPLAMSDPRSAFKSNPFVAVELELEITGVGPMFGGEPRDEERVASTMEFARGHTEQHHRATGTIEIDGEAVSFDGLGLRDHSWGPRSWQAPLYYRWLTGNFGEDFGFVASWIASRDGDVFKGGFVHRGEQRVGVRGIELETDWRGEARLHDRIRAQLACEDGASLAVEGRVLSLIPLRNRRDGHTTRISEGMTEWTCDGRTGYGLSEYLDQID
jgi:hypothetical protein